MEFVIVDRDEWTARRKDLLDREAELERLRAEVAAARAALPLVRLEKDYRFAGERGEVGLVDLFEGRRQLVLYHFMFDPEWEQGCKHCSLLVDNIGHLSHLHARDTTLALASRAPWPRIDAFRRRMGWSVPWYSTFGSDFNYDFHVTLDSSVAPVEYNFRSGAELAASGGFTRGEASGLSVFYRDGDAVHHSYSSYDGEDLLYGTFTYLDLTPLGRREGDRSWLRHHDRYDD